MPTILAITKLTLRSILRERVALSMLALLAGVWILLPAGLEGDGTVEGELRMLIRYTLGFSTVLLAGMTVWISCASVAGDLSSKRLQMVLTKPVSRGHVWWGKWLAVTLLITGLMIISAVATLVRVNGLLREAGLTADEKAHLSETLITSRKPAAPEEENFLPEAEIRLQRQLESGWQPPPQFSGEELLRRMVQHVRTLRYSVRGGDEVEWTFPLDTPVRPGERLQLGLRYEGGSMGMDQVRGEWILGTPAKPDLARYPVDDSPHGGTTLLFNTDGVFTGADRVTARFRYDAPEDRAVFFKPESGVRIYRPGGSFSFNLLRAVLMLSGLLSVLAALGVGAGSIFSLPVACYATSVVLVLQAFSGVLEDLATRGPDPAAAEEASLLQNTLDSARTALYRALRVALRPLDLDGPLDRVSRGVEVGPGELARILALRFTPLVLFFALAGILLFNRREAGGAV